MPRGTMASSRADGEMTGRRLALSETKCHRLLGMDTRYTRHLGLFTTTSCPELSPHLTKPRLERRRGYAGARPMEYDSAVLPLQSSPFSFRTSGLLSKTPIS